MDNNSYIISVSEGPGVYRHIRIACKATLLDLHLAIAAAYSLEKVKQPFFTAPGRAGGKKAARYGTNNTKTALAMRDITLEGAGFGGNRALAYTLTEPHVHFTCRTLRVLDEETLEPEAIRSSGGYFAFRLDMSKALRELSRKENLLQALEAVDKASGIPGEGRRMLGDYFLAASNLYGLVPLETLHALYNRRHRPLDLPAFTMFGILASAQDRTRFHVLDRKGRVLAAEHYPRRQAAYIAEYSVVDGGAFGFVLARQNGKPYYLPPEEEFLRYADEDYIEENGHFLRLKAHLQTLGLRPADTEACMRDTLTIIRFSGDGTLEFFGLLEDYGVRLKNIKAANHVLRLYVLLSNNTRTHFNCGHTPNEIIALRKESPRQISMDFIAAEPPPEAPAGQEEDPDLPAGDLPWEDFLPHPLPRTVEKKPGRNAPCPCGSGKKYKHCCGKPGTG